MESSLQLEKIAKLLRYYILQMTTSAGSGHLTSSFSAVELMAGLYFSQLNYDLSNPNNLNNDRVIFSKGHASALMYALYAVSGAISAKDLKSYRKFNSDLEGHPTANFKYTEAATGSLGQGLSVGLGMALALNFRFSKSTSTKPNIYVLLGDSELVEGSNWEAIQLASYYKVGNLVGILDVNRLGQRGETMLGWDLKTYKTRLDAFGWQTLIVNGHNFSEINKAYKKASNYRDKPTMIIAKTVKGKGVSFLENQDNWHGRALGEKDFELAVDELGDVNFEISGEIKSPDLGTGATLNIKHTAEIKNLDIPYKIGELDSTRRAYGEAIAYLGSQDENIVCLDGEVSNSTFSEIFKKQHPKRFFEMFIAEQNMVGVAVGMAKIGLIPFVSTFGAFLTRAHDQIRMAAYGKANIKLIGSHAGVAIGADGPSQMALEDFAMMKSILGSVVLCPADDVATWKLVEAAYNHTGIVYIRTNRPEFADIYKKNEDFKIGGSKVIRESGNDLLTVVACGVTLFEAIKAADELQKQGVNIRLIDAYSIKPIDEKGLRKAASETNHLMITVEDHYSEGGLGDAVLNVFAQSEKVKVYKMAVSKMPRSGKAEELLDYEEISKGAIVKKVKELIH